MRKTLTVGGTFRWATGTGETSIGKKCSTVNYAIFCGGVTGFVTLVTKKSAVVAYLNTGLKPPC